MQSRLKDINPGILTIIDMLGGTDSADNWNALELEELPHGTE